MTRRPRSPMRSSAPPCTSGSAGRCMRSAPRGCAKARPTDELRRNRRGRLIIDQRTEAWLRDAYARWLDRRGQADVRRPARPRRRARGATGFEAEAQAQTDAQAAPAEGDQGDGAAVAGVRPGSPAESEAAGEMVDGPDARGQRRQPGRSARRPRSTGSKIAHWQQAGGYKDETVVGARGARVRREDPRAAHRPSRCDASRGCSSSRSGGTGLPAHARRSDHQGDASATTSRREPRSSSRWLRIKADEVGLLGRQGGGVMATATQAQWPRRVPGRSRCRCCLPLRSDDTRLMTLSVSSLALFWRCPERWRRRYLEREREPQTGAMVIGKAVGATLAAYFAARMAGEPLSEQDADDLLGAEFDESAGRPDTDFGQDEPDTLREQSREALRAYLTDARAAGQAGERRAALRAALRGRPLVGRRLPRRRGRVGRHDRRQGRRQARQRGARRDATRSRRSTASPAGRRGGRTGASCFTRSGAARSARASAASSCRPSARPPSSRRWRRGSPRPPARSSAAPRPATGRCRRPDGWWCSEGYCPAWSGCPGGSGDDGRPS